MALNIPNQEQYLSLPEEMFVIGQDDAQAEEIVRPSTTYWHDVWARFRKDPLALVGLIGFACSSIFSVIYSTALKCHPEKANEISGLMITGVCGGAVIPPLMGFTTDLLGSQTGSLLVISACMLYLAGCALALRRFAAK